jgi:hypothetical protein
MPGDKIDRILQTDKINDGRIQGKRKRAAGVKKSFELFPLLLKKSWNGNYPDAFWDTYTFAGPGLSFSAA